MSRFSAFSRSASRPFVGRRAVVLVATVALFSGWPWTAAGATTATGRPAEVSTASGSTGVFAIDSDHHTVVFVPAAGGTPRPVTSGLTAPTQIAASRGGSIFIVDGTRLLKVTPRGAVLTIRTSMAAYADIAVDDDNYLFVHDGSSIVKYPPRDGASPVTVGAGDALADLTVDAVGNASLTGPDPADYRATVITTYPVRSGRPSVRKLVADYNPAQTEFQDRRHVIEARDGTIYLETSESGASGATDVYRIPPGPAGPTKAYPAMPNFSEYAYTVDSSSHFYLLQNRRWCADPSRSENGCLDDYGVDFVERYASSGTGRVDTAVTGVDLPVGGISVASTGTIYAAVLLSRSAVAGNSTAIAQLLRIDATGGAPVVLAKGHFTSPVAEDFRWFG